jgi:triosephosphate isomerase (TIM)
LCVGEALDVREDADQDEWVRRQLRSALEGLDDRFAELVTIAYEPIWAIGTGLTADTDQVQSMMTLIRSSLPAGLRDARVLYGGSVNAENAASLVAEGRADGFLVGGASLKAESFLAIIAACDDCYALKR